MSTKKQWEQAGKKWKKILKLDHYTIFYTYIDEIKGAGAETTIENNYFQATIKVDKKELAKIDYEQMNWLSLHEHLHIVLGSFDEIYDSILETMNKLQKKAYRDWVHTLTEQTVENLTKIMIDR